MADRTWNGVDARLYKEFKLSKVARLMLGYIIAHCPNCYGIYDPSPEHDCLDWFEGLFDRAQLVSSFDELVNCGIVERLRDDTCLWLKKKFKREIGAIRNPNGVKSAVNFLRSYSEIEIEFWSIYRNQLASKANQFVTSSPELANWLGTNWVEKGYYVTSIPIPIPSPSPSPSIDKSPAPPKLKTQGPPPRPKPKETTEPEKRAKPKKPKAMKPELPKPTEAALALAEKMDIDLANLISRGFPVGNNWRRRPVQIARSLDASGVTIDDATSAWEWALEDNWWQPELLKQMSFEKQPNRWVELVGKYLSRRQSPILNFNGNRSQPRMLEHAERGDE